MLLCLDAGNSQVFGGVFRGDELLVQFRRTSQTNSSSDELGVFFRSVLRENNVNPDLISKVAICCVVPDLLYSLRACCQKYFGLNPLILRPGIKTGLKIQYLNPKEVGADRIADAVGAITMFPNRNLIVADFGTATTYDVINKEKQFIGGAIAPGIDISANYLIKKAALLKHTVLELPKNIIGKNTKTNIQSGVMYSAIFSIEGMIQNIIKEINAETDVILTGGFSKLISPKLAFPHFLNPNLTLNGIQIIYRENQ